MSDERTTNGLTAEEIAEKVRARKQRSRWGGRFAFVGIVGFVLTAAGLVTGLVLYDRDIGVGALTLLGMFFAMASVGAGFADPAEIRGFWK